MMYIDVNSVLTLFEFVVLEAYKQDVHRNRTKVFIEKTIVQQFKRVHHYIAP